MLDDEVNWKFTYMFTFWTYMVLIMELIEIWGATLSFGHQPYPHPTLLIDSLVPVHLAQATQSKHMDLVSVV